MLALLPSVKLDKSTMPKCDSPSLGTASTGTDGTPETVTSGNIDSQNTNNSQPTDLPGTIHDNNETDDTASELSESVVFSILMNQI